WSFGQIGREVKLASDLHQRVITADIQNDIALLSQTAANLSAHARELAEGAVKLRELSGHTECAPNCRSRSQWGKGQCSCGAQPLSEVERTIVADVGSSESDSVV
ncbi:MAG TPA: hypothetical protein VFO62_03450, partial [Candidatus Binatia bacterium]|nr:hypothetical protein [Candidatus Binatia bacterium]